jgi:hypothetical protein
MNPSPYLWAIELKDHSTPRSVVSHDIFKMCVDKVFDFSLGTMRTLDIRLTRRKQVAKFEAYEIFEAMQRGPIPLAKKCGRKPKRVYVGRVAKHKSIKFADPKFEVNVENYMMKEFEIAGKQAVKLSPPLVLQQTECYKLI